MVPALSIAIGTTEGVRSHCQESEASDKKSRVIGGCYRVKLKETGRYCSEEMWEGMSMAGSRNLYSLFRVLLSASANQVIKPTVRTSRSFFLPFALIFSNFAGSTSSSTASGVVRRVTRDKCCAISCKGRRKLIVMG